MAATPNWTRPAFAPCKRNSYEGDYDEYYPVNKIAMISGDQLLLIDLLGRSVAPVTKSAEMISVGVMQSPASLKELPVPIEQVKSYLFVRTPDNLIQFLIQLNLDAEQIGKYTIPADFRKGAFNFYYLGDEKALIVQERKYPDRKGGARLAWMGADGKIVQTKDVVLAGKEEHELSGAESWKLIIATPEPIGTIIWCLTLWANYYVAEDKTEYIAEVHKFLAGTWLPMLTLCIFSAALGWLCYCRHRRMALPGIWYWTGFVFLFGLPGYFAYLFHRRWPILENCQICGQAVPRDREKCSSCGSDFPVPAPKGIEVFA